MMKYIYRYWILVPLLLLAILSRDWVEDPVQEVTESTIDMTTSEADYYLEKFETRKMDVQGKPEYIVTGETLSHFPEDDSSVIDSPYLVLYREGVVWTMESNQGVLTQNPETFFFEGSVSMLRTPQEKNATADSVQIDTPSEGNKQDNKQDSNQDSDLDNQENTAQLAGQQATPKQQQITLLTSNVTVRTTENIVETEQPIQVISENWQLSSVGLRSNLNDGTLQLLSKVKGRYEVAN